MGVLTNEEIHAGMLSLQQNSLELEEVQGFLNRIKETGGNIDMLLSFSPPVISESLQLKMEHISNTLFGEAASHGNVEAVKFLLDEGANANSHEALALMHASVLGHLEMVRFLVEQGKADTTIVRNNGRSALSYALQDNKMVTLWL